MKQSMIFFQAGDTFYQCDKCGKQFVHKSSFNMHIMAHDNIRDKSCPHCPLKFRSTSHLNRHIRIHVSFSTQHSGLYHTSLSLYCAKNQIFY